MNVEHCLSHAINHIVIVQEDLDEAMLEAFAVFETHHTVAAQALLDWLGDRRRTARWMSFHRTAFQGKSGYDLVIEGDIDALLEYVFAQCSYGNSRDAH